MLANAMPKPVYATADELAEAVKKLETQLKATEAKLGGAVKQAENNLKAELAKANDQISTNALVSTEATERCGGDAKSYTDDRRGILGPPFRHLTSQAEPVSRGDHGPASRDGRQDHAGFWVPSCSLTHENEDLRAFLRRRTLFPTRLDAGAGEFEPEGGQCGPRRPEGLGG